MYRKGRLSLLALLLAGVLSASPVEAVIVDGVAPTQEPKTMQVLDDLNVRTTPGIVDGNVVGMLHPGDQVTVVGSETDAAGTVWYAINLAGEIRYVSAEFVGEWTGQETATEGNGTGEEAVPEAAVEPEAPVQQEPVVEDSTQPEEVPEENPEEETKKETSKKKKKKKEENSEEAEPQPQEEAAQTVPEPTAAPKVTSTYENGEVAGPMEQKTIIKTEDVPSQKNPGHGYRFTILSNGSVEVEVY